MGDYGSSLKEVAIISDDEVWAVGQLVVPGKNKNAVRWNGQNWEIFYIPVVAINGDSSFGSVNAIYSIDSENIWVFSSAGSYGHWDGNNWLSEYVPERDGSINAIWGNSSSNVYFVGNNGSITHFDGENFSKQICGTSQDLNDITGITDPQTGKTRIWIAGTQVLLYSDDGENWQVVWEQSNPLFPDNFTNPTAVFIPDQCYIMVSVWNGQGSRMYRLNQLNFTNYSQLTPYPSFIRAMDGSNHNDIFLAGDFNDIYHYNGKSIYNYSQLQGYGQLLGVVSYKNDNVFVVGYVGSGMSKAIVLRGIR